MMNIRLTHGTWLGILAISFAVSVMACERSSPLQDGSDVASEPTAAWVTAFNAGEPTTLAALYAENARSLPPGGPPVTGRSQIESYWSGDMGEGDVTTTLTPVDAVAQEDLVHVEGTYQVKGHDGAEVAGGQYQQLWARENGQWLVQREMWRIDPALQREPQLAERLAASWTTAYNSGDAKSLLALYAEDAAISTVQEGTASGKPAIEVFWMGDISGTSDLTVTDAYIAGELAHFEGDYKVTDGGKITTGRYIQLWMRDPTGWRIHREMWWR
jgi:ketosteroid isomerase-like protein